MLFLAGSMSHADHAKLQTGFHNAKYHWPAFAGDTFKKKFVIKSVRYALTNLPTYSLTRSLTHLLTQDHYLIISTQSSK
jgi:hypothetical protein